MSLPRWPKYRDLAVEWLGEVPESWETKRLGYYFRERREKVSDVDYAALSVTKMGVVPQLETAAKTDDNDNRKKVLRGDFVINSRSDRKGSAGVSELDGSVSLINTVLQPQEAVYAPFVHYLLRSEPFQQEFYRFGKGIVADLWSTNYSEMRNIVIPMPQRDEQILIASFLDTETAKLDRLIVEQARLIELLKEKRRAVISHAVTKGLYPKVPMKHSGVELLGEVPAHWQATRLKYATALIVDCPHETPTYSDDGPHLVIRTADLDEGRMDESKMFHVSEPEYLNRIRRAPLLNGDIVYGREGERWGHAALVGRNNRYCLGQRMMQFRTTADVSPEYLMWALNADTAYVQGEVDTVGATSPHVNVETIRNYRLALPPLAEQREIAQFLSKESLRFDSLVLEAGHAITLLQERRVALVAAAVTGKVDVRGLVDTEAA